MKNCLIIVFLFFASVSYGQSLNKNWNKDLNNDLEQFMDCDSNLVNGLNPCYKFVGSAVTTVYQVNDFYSEELGRHMVVSEISDYLKQSNQWSLIGHGYEQKALDEAQKKANAGKAVIAIYLNEDGLGHLSVILPGKLTPSGTWGFDVPNSSSFFISRPENSYVNKGLSYAFEKSQLIRVMIYARK